MYLGVTSYVSAWERYVRNEQGLYGFGRGLRRRMPQRHVLLKPIGLQRRDHGGNHRLYVRYPRPLHATHRCLSRGFLMHGDEMAEQ